MALSSWALADAAGRRGQSIQGLREGQQRAQPMEQRIGSGHQIWHETSIAVRPLRPKINLKNFAKFAYQFDDM